MEQSKIDRINELYRKSKAEGLTEAEIMKTSVLAHQEGTDTAAQGICGGCEEKPDSTVEQY